MSIIATRTQAFLVSGVAFQVNHGSSCYMAIEAASTILSGVNGLLAGLVDDAPDNANEVYAIRVLTQQCEALIDAVAVSIREAEDNAPQNQTYPVRGAEVSQ
ncbi:hypothetical protein G7011_01380 [Pseudomonas plecoglossicida]|uniref:hypothetical protein n=1 Tax=Pseudomonas plecoglossicida TaxID=70775 RepID=UPI0015E45E76|nr:hypothetical protein [Pseudomonas plecoglossicida]MBA1195763.1 hypothetical protein [Pseudomonas plecoglossicida]